MSGVVASALMSTPVLRDAVNILGVREAGTDSIMRMFKDGFQVNMKAGYVSSEGRGELFKFEPINRSTCTRVLRRTSGIAHSRHTPEQAPILTRYCFAVVRCSPGTLRSWCTQCLGRL